LQEAEPANNKCNGVFLFPIPRFLPLTNLTVLQQKKLSLTEWAMRRKQASAQESKSILKVLKAAQHQSGHVTSSQIFAEGSSTVGTNQLL
jgi:NADH:ubiquinone oxidoreductase subunit E